MDEGVSRLSFAISAQETMPRCQRVAKALERTADAASRVVVVVEMDFDFTEAPIHQFAEAVDVIGVIRFRGIKEGVTGRPTIGIEEPCHELWILLLPPAYALHRYRPSWLTEVG